MSSKPLDQQRRVASGNRKEEPEAIPWSQQVEEASCENLCDNRNFDFKTKDRKDHCEFRRQEKLLDKEKLNMPDTSNDTKKDYDDVFQKNTHRNIKKLFHSKASSSIPIFKNEDYLPPEHLFVDNLSMLSNSNINKKRITWASIASQPAKPNRKNHNPLSKKKGPGMPPPPMIPGKHSLDITTWGCVDNISFENCEFASKSSPSTDIINTVEHESSSKQCKPYIYEQQSISRKQMHVYNNRNSNTSETNATLNQGQDCISGKNNKNFIRCQDTTDEEGADEQLFGESSYFLCNVEPELSDAHIILKRLQDRNNYNPAEFDLQRATLSRFFVIKSYSEDDIHRSIKYEIWCSTDHGNKRLDEAFKERVKEGGNVMLFFSVNGSGHFCGMAQMITSVDYNSTSSVWSQDKWKGKFKVKWIYVKDVPNSQLRHIRLENNDNKSVTNSRDTQEVPNSKGLQVLRVLHSYKHQTSIFDDFYHYEKKQEESKKNMPLYHLEHLPSSSNNNHDIIKQENTDRIFGHFKDRAIVQRAPHNFFGNRRYCKSIEYQKNKGNIEKSMNCLNKEREHEEADISGLQESGTYFPESLKSNISKKDNKDIILHMDNLKFEEKSVVEKKIETKFS